MTEHALSDRAGDWRVSIVGSQANDRWEMKITGANAFERSYTLEGTAGEHEAAATGPIVSRPKKGWSNPGRRSDAVCSWCEKATDESGGRTNPGWTGSGRKMLRWPRLENVCSSDRSRVIMVALRDT